MSAYILVADPAFLRASVRAYYDRVDEIVLSYDATSTSWTGTPLPVAECLRIIDALDVEGKCRHLPGSYARVREHPLDCDTYQRQEALDAASHDTDWVLQLDTDEVMLDPGAFFGALERADATGASGLDYPSRWLYSNVGDDLFLESSTRFWRARASYPGPMAVRAGTRLSLARQADVPLHRVDFRPWNTDPAHPHTAPVHAVIAPSAGIAHYSWVRDDETMQRKFRWSGHAEAYSKPEVYRRWAGRQRRPLLTALGTPARRDDWFRLSHISEPREEA
ncbi:hypothetical protein [Microbacterium kribbense]|uniref:hypothetical protein n=1 Tax=Microbacterium kribbense TaxID=433645 RepID=UPI0031E17E0D